MRIMRIFMRMKGEDAKKPKNISIRPSVEKLAAKKAEKVAKRLKLPYVSFSHFIEIMIYEYAE